MHANANGGRFFLSLSAVLMCVEIFTLASVPFLTWYRDGEDGAGEGGPKIARARAASRGRGGGPGGESPVRPGRSPLLRPLATPHSGRSTHGGDGSGGGGGGDRRHRGGSSGGGGRGRRPAHASGGGSGGSSFSPRGRSSGPSGSDHLEPAARGFVAPSPVPFLALDGPTASSSGLDAAGRTGLPAAGGLGRGGGGGSSTPGGRAGGDAGYRGGGRGGASRRGGRHAPASAAPALSAVAGAGASGGGGGAAGAGRAGAKESRSRFVFGNYDSYYGYRVGGGFTGAQGANATRYGDEDVWNDPRLDALR